MFIGHYSAALAAASSPRAPRLGVLFVGAQLVDLGFFSLMIAGVEKMRFEPGATVMNPMDLYFMPYTHSLIGSLLWAAGFGLLVWAATRRTAAGLIAAAVVFSHWLLDFVTHRPDLALPNGDKVGLGLWNHPTIEMPLEIGLTLGGLWLFLRATQPATPAGRWSWAVLLVALLCMQAVNWFGPVAPEVTVATGAEALFAYVLAIALGWWVAKGRRFRGGAAAAWPTPT